MSRKRIVLRIEDDYWSAQRFDSGTSDAEASRIKLCEGDESPSAVAASIERLVPRPNTYAYTLLLDSPRVFASRFLADDFGGANDHQTLAFRFEEDLPVNAEDLLCDFVIPKRSQARSSDSILALGTERDLVLGLNHSMQQKGLQLDSVLAESLALTQTVIANKSLSRAGCLLVPSADSLDAVIWEDACLIAWRHGLSPSNIERDLQLLFGELGREFTVDVLPNEHSDKVMGSLPDVLKAQEVGLQGKELDNALVECIANRRDLWSDFSRDPALKIVASTKRTQLTLLCLSACCLIVAACAWWKSWELDSERQRVIAEQFTTFGNAFPGQRAPNAVLKRMRSELTKARGASSPQLDVELPRSSMDIIQGIVDALPEADEASIQELRVTKQNTTLTLRLKTHETAAAVADRLREASFSVTPPTTETLRDTVRATLTITPAKGV